MDYSRALAVSREGSTDMPFPYHGVAEVSGYGGETREIW